MDRIATLLREEARIRAEVKKLQQRERRHHHSVRLTTCKLQDALLAVWWSEGKIEWGMEFLHRHHELLIQRRSKSGH
jgi:hypothetical protein